MSFLDPHSPRSLILAGGGIRVAYHAGVLQALEEAGLTFAHVDGTSGGVFGTAMLASGVTPTEAARRWRALDLRGFMKPLPLRSYFTSLPAIGSATGIRDKIFPGLGIDLGSIRSNAQAAFTFNVCNFTQKTLESIPHTTATLDHLIAGVSLPLFMPVVPIGGASYLDGVWIKDANLTTAYERGAAEAYLVWCIGNTPTYRPGLFHQYVHMIEIAANGALFEEMAALSARAAREGRPWRVHVIKPSFALPLDPDFVLHRIDADTLINIGYADTKRYLADPRPVATPLSNTPAAFAAATAMSEPGPSYHYRARYRGILAGAPRSINLGVFLRPTGTQLYASIDWAPGVTASAFDATQNQFRFSIGDALYAITITRSRFTLRALNPAAADSAPSSAPGAPSSASGAAPSSAPGATPFSAPGSASGAILDSATLRQPWLSRLRNRWYASVFGVDGGPIARAHAKAQLQKAATTI